MSTTEPEVSMARPLTLSNGELHVGLDQRAMVQDIYFPYVGVENHTPGSDIFHRVGVWVDGTLSWIDGSEWKTKLGYPHSALIGHTTAVNNTLGIALEFDDFVDAERNVFLRNIHVVNLRDQTRNVRLFMSQAFKIGDAFSNADTAQFLPRDAAILHYRGKRAFMVSGLSENAPFDQYTVGTFGVDGLEGTYRDAEDGELEQCAVETGKVDSTIRFSLTLTPHGSTRVHYWLTAGTSLQETQSLHQSIREDGLLERQQATADWWHNWLKPAYDVSPRIKKTHHESFIRSLMIIRSHIDKRGAVMASTDTTARDVSSYCWPRDAAFTLWPLIRLGYTKEPQRFFSFCKQNMHPGGYMLQRYQADGAPGSSWYSYVHEHNELPIQEDETALVLFMFVQFYQETEDKALLDEFYRSLAKPMADFLSDYIDPASGLPRPSYDIWGETFQTTTFTTSAVYGALIAASELAAAANDNENAVSWRAAAEDIKQVAQKKLFNPETNTFYRGITSDGSQDNTVDMSSMFGAFMFGLFPATGPEITRAMHAAKSIMQFDYEAPTVPRFTGESDHALQDNESWWPIAVLWLAQYELETNNPEVTERLLDWIKDHMLTSGALAQQFDPKTDTPRGATPYVWSHAEYIATLLDTISDAPHETPKVQ